MPLPVLELGRQAGKPFAGLAARESKGLT